MKQLTFQFPRRKRRAVQTRTIRNKQPVTWVLSEEESAFFLQTTESSLNALDSKLKFN